MADLGVGQAVVADAAASPEASFTGGNVDVPGGVGRRERPAVADLGVGGAVVTGAAVKVR